MFEVIFKEFALYAAAGGFLAVAVAAFTYLPIFKKEAAAVLFAIAVALLSYEKGYEDRGAKDHSQIIQAQLEEANRQISATKKVADEASEREREIQRQADLNSERISDYERQLKEAGEKSACNLDAYDVDVLRNTTRSSKPPLPPKRPFFLRHPSGAP